MLARSHFLPVMTALNLARVSSVCFLPRFLPIDEQKNILAVSAKASRRQKRSRKMEIKTCVGSRLRIKGNMLVSMCVYLIPKCFLRDINSLSPLYCVNRLRGSIIQIQENDDTCEWNRNPCVRQKSGFQQQSEELTSKCDSVHADLDKKARTISKFLHEKYMSLSPMLRQYSE